jgi:hypothetical protein
LRTLFANLGGIALTSTRSTVLVAPHGAVNISFTVARAADAASDELGTVNPSPSCNIGCELLRGMRLPLEPLKHAYDVGV